jgi:hypothetical protein
MMLSFTERHPKFEKGPVCQGPFLLQVVSVTTGRGDRSTRHPDSSRNTP